MFRRSKCRRSGTVLIAALVCMVVIIGLLGSLFQGSLRARRQLHAERDRRQTEFMLQAGVARAALRLAQEPDYRGEIWNLPADAIARTSAGQVTINATRDADHRPWEVQVVAEYVMGGEHSIRRSRTILVPTKEQL